MFLITLLYRETWGREENNGGAWEKESWWGRVKEVITEWEVEIGGRQKERRGGKTSKWRICNDPSHLIELIGKNYREGEQYEWKEKDSLKDKEKRFRCKHI